MIPIQIAVEGDVLCQLSTSPVREAVLYSASDKVPLIVPGDDDRMSLS